MKAIGLRWHGRGFTLIELVVTVAILGVLALGALPLAELTVQRGKERELRESLRSVRMAIDEYKRASDEGRIAREAGSSGYPPSLEILANGVTNMRDPAKAKVFFLRRVPRDPFNADPDVPSAQTWGLRSYASAPDDPQPGKDVYDLYSLSPRVGINGNPYRMW